MNRRFYLLLCIFVFLASCASTSLFAPYTHQAQNYRAAITTNDYSKSLAQLDKKIFSADGLLYLQESARLHQLKGDSQSSISNLEAVYQWYQKNDEHAVFSLSNIGAKGVSLLSNENATPYQGAAYERILAILFQAFNYLEQGKADAAAVEIRRAAFEQRQQEIKYDNALSDTDDAAQKQNLDNKSWASDPKYSGLDLYTNKLRNSFLNAYCYYTSAVFWEASQDYNAALIDYKKTLEIQPDNAQVRQDIERLTRIQSGKPQKNPNFGAVVFLFEEGFVPAKRSFNLLAPSLYYDTFFSVAVPYYERADIPTIQTLNVFQNDQRIATTSTLTHISSLAIKHQHEQMPGLIVRQLLRARSKYELQRQASQQTDIGGFFAAVYNIVSEQADLRSWLSLPNSAQATRLGLAQGEHNLLLSSNGTEQTLKINIQSERTTIVRIVKASKRFIINQYML